jgi:cytochrome oxidase Cu insertion factor (SCO1/SenC/PrrC family)
MRFLPYILFICVVLVGSLLTGWLYTSHKPSPAEVAIKLSYQINLGGDFTLKNHLGQPVSSKDFRGKVLLVYFGYTFCPDFCPTELKAISDAMKLLGHRAERVQPIFITIDPDRDTAKVLEEYRKHFDKRLITLYGTEQEVKEVADKFKVFYAKVDEKGIGDKD